MMQTPDDNRLDEAIARAVGADRPHFDADQWKQRHPDAVRRIESWKTDSAGASRAGSWQRWRNIMHGRTRKAIAAAVVAAAIILGITMIGGGGSSSKLFAEAVRQIQAARYTFTLRAKTAKGASSDPVKAMILEPGRIRFELSGGLGKISFVFDTRSGEHLLLFHRFKAAYDAAPGVGDSGRMPQFLAMFRGPVESLWNLKDNKYKELGRKKIDGKPAEGFEVVVKTDHDQKTIRETITVWAHAKTGKPLVVTVAMETPDAKAPAMEFTMTDFDMDVELDEALFSTKVPEGYVLAYQKTLKQLATPETAAAKSDAEAEKVLRVLSLWSGGNKRAAIDLLLKVDWGKKIRFARDVYLFTLTEGQYVSLTAADQKKVMAEIIPQLSPPRRLAKETLKLGREALAAKDTAAAEKHFTAVLQLGWLLNRTKDSMLIVRLVGISIRNIALDDLAKLYEGTGQTEKLQATREESRQLKAAHEQIKRGLSK